MLRQVRLKTARVNSYPNLTPGVWYTAAAAAARVKALRILQEGPSTEIEGRVLPPIDFEFRGGSERRDCWVGLKTRRSDRHPHSRSFTESWIGGERGD
jgi:hypothetical protein